MNTDAFSYQLSCNACLNWLMPLLMSQYWSTLSISSRHVGKTRLLQTRHSFMVSSEIQCARQCMSEKLTKNRGE